jgi:hypothetical protein
VARAPLPLQVRIDLAATALLALSFRVAPILEFQMRSLMLIAAAAAVMSVPLGSAAAQGSPDAVAAPVAAPAAAPAAAKPAEAGQKTAEQLSDDRENEMICKRDRETGSLVRTKKTCHTRSQWAYIKSENQRMGQDFIIANQNRPSGN